MAWRAGAAGGGLDRGGELVEGEVVNRGWPAARYGTFIAEAMIAALLPPELPAPRPGNRA